MLAPYFASILTVRLMDKYALGEALVSSMAKTRGLAFIARMRDATGCALGQSSGPRSEGLNKEVQRKEQNFL